MKRSIHGMERNDGVNVFKNLLRELKKVSSGQQLIIDMPLDENGYFDRKCPNTECARDFKIKFEDWLNNVKGEVVYCPICKHEATAAEWNTEEQADYIKAIGLNHIQSQIGNAMKKDAIQSSRKQKPGFMSMSLSYKPGNKIITIPPSVVKELEQNYTCSICHCRYSFLGSAYFCPACGNENIASNLSEWIRNIDNFIFKYPEIKYSLSTILPTENAESYLTQLVEEHYCKIVSIFQAFAENLFKEHRNSEKIKTRKNLFQNLNESSLKWKELTNKAYGDIFDIEKYECLKEHFQVRHLLMHTSGIIDENFKKIVNNPKYNIGSRVIITIDLLAAFLTLTKELMNAMNENWK